MRSAASGSTNAKLAVLNVLTNVVRNRALGDVISSLGDQRVWNGADACLITCRSDTLRESVGAPFANSTYVVERHVRIALVSHIS